MIFNRYRVSVSTLAPSWALFATRSYRGVKRQELHANSLQFPPQPGDGGTGPSAAVAAGSVGAQPLPDLGEVDVWVVEELVEVGFEVAHPPRRFKHLRRVDPLWNLGYAAAIGDD